jgi:2-haloacid dehalogenase
VAPPTTVLFDLGGVFIDWDPRHLYRSVFEDEAEREHFLRHVCGPAFNHSLDGGVRFAAAIARATAAHPHYATQIAQYQTGWNSMCAGLIDGMERTLDELQELEVPVFALTNWSAETWPRGVRLFPLLSRFEGVVVSGQEGVCKPEPAIYRIAIERFGLTPGRTVFVDDNAANVAAAQALGFVGHLFEGCAPLRQALGRWDLLG